MLASKVPKAGSVSAPLARRKDATAAPKRQTEAQLWELLFSCPWEWWDYRCSKRRGPSLPDFRHKVSQLPLWLNSWSKPGWVDDRLHALCVRVNGNAGHCDHSTSWQGLVQTLCAQGQLNRAVDVAIAHLDMTGVPVNGSTDVNHMHQDCTDDKFKNTDMYLALLKACNKAKALSQLKKIHALLSRQNLEVSNSLADHLVVALANCGAFDDASQYFFSLERRTVYSWTAMISGSTTWCGGQEALKLYDRMLEDGVEPDEYTFVSLFKACASTCDLEEAFKLHRSAEMKGYTADVFVASALLCTYGKCRSIGEAEIVFCCLPERDVISWNAMLSTYVEQGLGERALLLFRQMQNEAVNPNNQTLLIALQACCILILKKDMVEGARQMEGLSLKVGQALHADAHKAGSISDLFVVSTLVNMYGKHGSLSNAEQVFSGSIEHDSVSWSTMLSVYVDLGQGKKVLQLYRQMQEEGISPDQQAFIVSLQACGMFGDKEELRTSEGQLINLLSFELAQAIHFDACTRGLAADVFVGSTLVTTYGKCGSVVEAETVFEELSEHDIVLWSAMISAYVEQGQGVAGLHLFRQMQEEGVSPNQQSFAIALQACGNLGTEEGPVLRKEFNQIFLDLGRALHYDVCRKGWNGHALVGNALLNMYANCESIVEAESVFERIPKHDIALWNSMLSVYVNHDQAEKALLLYRQMQEECICLNGQAFVIVLQACSMLGVKDETWYQARLCSLEVGQALHFDVRQKGLILDIFLGSTLLSMYGKCGSIIVAELVFDGLIEHDVVSWTAMLSAYMEQGLSLKALQLYRQMQEEGVCPNRLTLTVALQACAALGRSEDVGIVELQLTQASFLELGEALHFDACREGLDLDDFVGNSLLSMYGKCGDIEKAEDVFDGLSEHGTISLNAMLSVHAEQGEGERALKLYREMQANGAIIDDITIVCVLEACKVTGSVEACNQIYYVVLFAGLDGSPCVGNTLVRVYGCCAGMRDAQAVFEALIDRDLMSWNAYIAGFAQEGDSTACFQVFEEMQLANVAPSEVTFLSLLLACSHDGLVHKGAEFFQSMSRDYGLVPSLKHDVIMVDLLGRVGEFEVVENMLWTTTRQSDPAVWLSLLGACRLHGNTELGRQAFDCTIRLNPEKAAAYILMSNIYSDASLREHTNEVGNLRHELGAWG